MARKKSIASLRKELDRKHRERCALHDELALERLRDGVARNRVRTKRHESILAAGLKSLEIDPKSIVAEHAKERTHVRKMVVRQKAQLAKENKRRRARHLRTLKSLAARKDVLEYHVGNPHLAFCDWSAAGVPITRVSFQNSSNVSVRGPAFQHVRDGINEWQLRMRGEAGPLGGFQRTLDLNTDFVWNAPPENGLMRAATMVSALGTYSVVALPYSCAPNAWARVRLTARLESWQVQGAVWLSFSSPGQLTLADYTQIGPTGDGLLVAGIGAGINDEEFLELSAFPVVAGAPVILRVIVHAEIAGGNGGEAELDIRGGSERINVPAAWISHSSN